MCFTAATGARFLLVGRLSNWQMREWPLLVTRPIVSDGVNALRWRNSGGGGGGYPTQQERVEVFVNVPALLLLDGAPCLRAPLDETPTRDTAGWWLTP